MLLFFLNYGVPFLISGLYFGLMSKARVSGLVAATSLLPVLVLVAVPIIGAVYGPTGSEREQITLVGISTLVVVILQLLPIFFLLVARWNKVEL